MLRSGELQALKYGIDLARRQVAAERLPQVGVGIDVDHAEHRIGAVPGQRLDLALAHIGLERLLGLRASEEQEAGAGKAEALADRVDEGVGPDCVEALHRGEIDELVEIAFPGPAEIIQEQQPPAVVDQHPARRHDGGDAAEIAAIEPEPCQQVDRPERQPYQHPAQQAGLHIGDAR